MSRFDELCEALRAVRSNYNDYRERCFDFANAMVTGLHENLEAPEGFVNFFAQEGPLAGRKVDGPAAAMHLRDDGFWIFGIAIDLHEDPSILPYDCVAIGVLVKYIDEQFLVRFDHDDELSFEISQPAELQQIYDYLYDLIRGRYENSFRKFIAGDSTDRYGFG